MAAELSTPPQLLTPTNRRDFLAKTGRGSFLMGVTALLGPAILSGCHSGTMSHGQRDTIRSLFDAAVPGTWNGVVEDTLLSGAPAPGADDALVLDWLEQVSDALPAGLDWLTQSFLAAWADDLDLWSDTFHGLPFTGTPKFWELPLDPSIWGRGRQHKIILMQTLFGTLIDIKYLGAISLAKVAFYSDLWFEANDPTTRVGREYIGFPLPPGAQPYLDFTYNQVLGFEDTRLVSSGALSLTNLP